MPRLSVLIPAYNSADTLLRALESAQTQTLRDLEIILVDDASTDATAALAESRAADDPRIRVLRSPKNAGPSAARNLGIRSATGEWIALLDADDMYLPDRLERMLARASSQDVLLADNLELYDHVAQKTVKLAIDPAVLTPELRLDAQAFVARCQTNQPNAVDFGLLKPLLRRSHLLAHGITYDETSRHGEDFRFYLDMLLAGGTMLVLPEAYYRYTEPHGTISRKESGVSKTVTHFASLEAQTRALAADPRYARVAKGLNLRAEAIRRLAKILLHIENFRRQSRFGKLLRIPSLLADRDMRHHLATRLRLRFSRR